MARPRKYFFFTLDNVKSLSKGDKINIGHENEFFQIHKIHPRKGGVTVTKEAPHAQDS